MSNTLYYKFRGDDQIYVGEHSCTNHYRTPQSFISTRQLIFKEGEKIPNNVPYYMRRSSLDYKYEDIEWIEYRIPVEQKNITEDIKDWYCDLLMDSSIGGYLKRANNTVVYRFDLNECATRNLFIISLMRYIEEQQLRVIELFKAKLDHSANEQLAILSATIVSNHSVFNPIDKLPGLFSIIDHYFNLMLTYEKHLIKDGSNGIYTPRAVTLKWLGATDTFWGCGGNKSIVSAISHFSKKVDWSEHTKREAA